MLKPLKYTLAILIISAFQSCSNKCHIGCTSSVRLCSIGYSLHELDSMTINTYVADGSFSTRLTSTIARNKDTGSQEPQWSNVYGVNDTTGDTLGFEPMQTPEILQFDFDRGRTDIEIIIPSSGKTYRFSGIVFSGPESIQGTCDPRGNAPSVSCNRSFSTYVLNGSAVNLGSGSSTIYFQK